MVCGWHKRKSSGSEERRMSSCLDPPYSFSGLQFPHEWSHYNLTYTVGSCENKKEQEMRKRLINWKVNGYEGEWHTMRTQLTLINGCVLGLWLFVYSNLFSKKEPLSGLWGLGNHTTTYVSSPCLFSNYLFFFILHHSEQSAKLITPSEWNVFRLPIWNPIFGQ